jgi:hypothetical protein
MAIDWNTFKRDLDAAIDQAADKTDAQLAGHIATITRLSPAEIQQLYPDSADAKKLAALMQVVNSSTTENEKINQLVAHSEEFAGIILPLLKKLV